MPNEPYWIIVSEEGPSTHPKRHATFEAAKTESIRLAKLHPELKFDVYEYAGTTTATPAKRTVTKWVTIFEDFSGTLGYRMVGTDYLDKKPTLFDTKEEAENPATWIGVRFVAAPPRNVEIGVDQSVSFEVPSKPCEVEYRYYHGNPAWGFVRLEAEARVEGSTAEAYTDPKPEAK